VCGGQLQTITYCQKLLPNAALPVNTLRNTHNRVYIKLKISICVLIKLALAPTGSKKTFSHVFAEYSTKRITEEMQQQRTAISFYWRPQKCAQRSIENKEQFGFQSETAERFVTPWKTASHEWSTNSINRSIKTHLHSTVCRERIRGAELIDDKWNIRFTRNRAIGQIWKRTDFTDTRTALRLFFSVSVFFLVFSYRYFLPF